MNQSSTQIKEILFDCLNAMSENPWIYTDQNNLFSRKRKISFSDAILSTICMQRSSSKEEILKYYDFMTNAPTHSALIQQRNKLKPSAFEDLFYRFTNVVTPDLRYKGYRLFAVDGSDIYIPRNPNEGFNMLHLNAAYDLVSKLFTDIIIQPVNHINEYNAMCDMIDRYAQLHSEEKAIFIADRGFTSFNVFAHAIENGVFFLIRGREPSPRSMLSTLDLPDEPEFEIIFERWLTRRKYINLFPQEYLTIWNRKAKRFTISLSVSSSSFCLMDLQNIFIQISRRKSSHWMRSVSYITVVGV